MLVSVQWHCIFLTTCEVDHLIDHLDDFLLGPGWWLDWLEHHLV